MGLWDYLDEQKVPYPRFRVVNPQSMPILKIQDFNVVEIALSQETVRNDVETLKTLTGELSARIIQISEIMKSNVEAINSFVLEITENLKGNSNAVYERTDSYEEIALPQSYAAVVGSPIFSYHSMQKGIPLNVDREDFVAVVKNERVKNIVQGSDASDFKLKFPQTERLFSFRVRGLSQSVSETSLTDHFEEVMGFSPTTVTELKKADENINLYNVFTSKSIHVVTQSEKEVTFLSPVY